MTIYFKNGENLHIAGKEGDLIKQHIASAFEHRKRDWLVIYNTEDRSMGNEIPALIIDLMEVVAVR